MNRFIARRRYRDLAAGRSPRAERIASALASVASALAIGVPAQAATDAEAKAVLLLGIAQLAQWEHLPAADVPFRICLFGTPALELPLRIATAGETAHERPIEVQRIRSPDEALGRCQLVFVAGNVARAFAVDDGHEVTRKALIVGERPGFAVGPGAVNFFVESGRVGFEVNRRLTELAGVRLGSRILRRARFVEDEREAR